MPGDFEIFTKALVQAPAPTTSTSVVAVGLNQPQQEEEPGKVVCSLKYSTWSTFKEESSQQKNATNKSNKSAVSCGNETLNYQ